MITKDKVRATFLGIGIGDALGKPVEMKTAEYIKETYGRIDKYLDCSGHKYFENDKKGTTTDDWQLSAAVAKAYIKSGEFNIKTVAQQHVDEFKKSVRGWGGSTREAISKIANGTPWDQASITDNPKLGVGNGIAMKVAPIGIYMALTGADIKEITEAVIQLSIMTHRTSMAITSGLAQTLAIFQCLRSNDNSEVGMPFNPKSFLTNIGTAGMIGRRYLSETITEDDIANRFNLLHDYESFSTENIIEKFKGGCYVYESLPFTYAFFLKNPNSIESLFDCVSAGGDSDSNGSMIAALLGALHGTKIFPDHLIDELDGVQTILEIADQFYDKFTKSKNVVK